MSLPPVPGSYSSIQKAQISTRSCTSSGKRIPHPKLFWPSFPSEPYAEKLGQRKSFTSLISHSRSLRPPGHKGPLLLSPYLQASCGADQILEASCGADQILEASALEEREGSRADQAPPPRARIKCWSRSWVFSGFLVTLGRTAPALPLLTSHRSQS